MFLALSRNQFSSVPHSSTRGPFRPEIIDKLSRTKPLTVVLERQVSRNVTSFGTFATPLYSRLLSASSQAASAPLWAAGLQSTPLVQRMDTPLKIVTHLPLRELWQDNGSTTTARGSSLSRDGISDLLRVGPVQFVVVDVGA